MKRLALVVLSFSLLPGSLSAARPEKEKPASKWDTQAYIKRAQDTASSCWEGAKNHKYTVGSGAGTLLLIAAFYKYCPLAKKISLGGCGCCSTAAETGAAQAEE